MSQRITLTNEVELERARLQCLPDVQGCAHSCRAKLTASYVESLGSLDRIPVMVAPLDELEAGSVDHRAGFLLSQVDGATNLETILDVSGMPPLDALRIVRELVRRGIVALRAGVPDHDEHEVRLQ